jgi:hypothetical protein
MTLDELRHRFWWLGDKGSYIVALDGDRVTVKVIQTSWARRTQAYEDSVARDFAALGLHVQWEPFFAEALEAEIVKARESATAAGKVFDRAAFVEMMRKREAESNRR